MIANVTDGSGLPLFPHPTNYAGKHFAFPVRPKHLLLFYLILEKLQAVFYEEKSRKICFLSNSVQILLNIA